MGNSQSTPTIGVINMGARKTETIGCQTTLSVQFDDYEFLKGKFNTKLHEIKIWSDSFYIIGIQTLYSMDGGISTPGSHVGSRSGKCTIIPIKSNEYVSNLVISSGNFIDSNEVHLNSGTTFKVGASGGKAKSFTLSPGWQFFSFGGSTNEYLDTLYANLDEVY